MKKLLSAATVTMLVGILTSIAMATPSTTFWTPCTLDFQPANQTHITYDTYNRFGNPTTDNVPAFPVDYGLTKGAAFKNGLAFEYGVDFMVPTKNPAYFNVKVGYPELTLKPWAPALEIGIFNVGTKAGQTNQDVVYFLVGRSLPNNLGRLSAAYYVGNKTALGFGDTVNSIDNTGAMVAYDKVLIKDKVVFAADWATGTNAIGGGGAGLYYYFTPNIDLLAGPVWFNDKEINGKMKFTVQCDINY